MRASVKLMVRTVSVSMSIIAIPSLKVQLVAAHYKPDKKNAHTHTRHSEQDLLQDTHLLQISLDLLRTLQFSP